MNEGYDTNEYESLKRKLEFFKDNDIPIHITKNNGRFYNGVILELAGDMIILNDKILGAIPIYFMEIKCVEKMK